MSLAHITTRDHVDIPDLGSHLGPCRCSRVVQNFPFPLLADAVWRAGLSDSTWESGLCTLQGQHRGAGPAGRGTDELAPVDENVEKLAPSHLCHEVAQVCR